VGRRKSGREKLENGGRDGRREGERERGRHAHGFGFGIKFVSHQSEL